MSEVLTPKVGDKVRVVNKDGSEVVGLVLETESHSVRIKHIGWLEEALGWKVAEIVEPAKPPAETLIQGVDVKGYEFKGFVADDEGRALICGVKRVDGVWRSALYSWHHIASWEVVS